MTMQIEFDPAKDRINRSKHGVGLEVAAVLFATPSIQWVSPRNEQGEVRYIAVGLLEGVEFTCVFTMRNRIPRIISVRRSRHEERERFWKVRRGQLRSREDDS